MNTKKIKRWTKGMRDTFSESLYAIMKKDKKVILVTSDTGAICHDKIKKNLPAQYINVGIAEQNMIGISAGLALSGKIVFAYAIVPFATMRCFEQIRVNLCCMKLPVTVVGVGAGFDYSTLGPTHHGTEDISLMRSLPDMTVYSPSDSIMADYLAQWCYRKKGPKYVRLDREGFPLIYSKEANIDEFSGFSLVKKGKDIVIVSTGRMVYTALAAARKLSRYKLNPAVIDLFKIKPLKDKKIMSVINEYRYVVTLEEHFLTGGVGSLLSEILARRKNVPILKSIAIPDSFCRCYGKREYLKKANDLDVDSVIKAVVQWIKENR